MVLIDTSVWIAHFRKASPGLVHLLEEGQVVCHPFIVGELACGNLRNRREILELLKTLHTSQGATHEETLHFIETHRLMGTGLGYIDVHLLASAMLSRVRLWTLDHRLKQAASRLGIVYQD